MLKEIIIRLFAVDNNSVDTVCIVGDFILLPESVLFYLLMVGAEGYCRSGSYTYSMTHTHTHTLYEFSGRGIGTSQRPLLDKTQLLKKVDHLFHRRDSKQQSQKASGHRTTPLTARPPSSAAGDFTKDLYQ